MRSGLVRDGVKWGFAEKGLGDEPLSLISPTELARQFLQPLLRSSNPNEQ